MIPTEVYTILIRVFFKRYSLRQLVSFRLFGDAVGVGFLATPFD